MHRGEKNKKTTKKNKQTNKKKTHWFSLVYRNVARHVKLMIFVHSLKGRKLKKSIIRNCKRIVDHFDSSHKPSAPKGRHFHVRFLCLATYEMIYMYVTLIVPHLKALSTNVLGLATKHHLTTGRPDWIYYTWVHIFCFLFLFFFFFAILFLENLWLIRRKVIFLMNYFRTLFFENVRFFFYYTQAHNISLFVFT